MKVRVKKTVEHQPNKNSWTRFDSKLGVRMGWSILVFWVGQHNISTASSKTNRNDPIVDNWALFLDIVYITGECLHQKHK